MNRRMALRVLAALHVSLVAGRAAAQRSRKMPVVGLLVTHPPVTDKVVQALRDGLRQFGFEDGKNFRFEVRTALGQIDRIPMLAQELVSMPADVIVLVNELALRAVNQVNSTIPLVMVGYTDDPVSLGWIESYRRPGGNVTGIFNVNSALTGKRLEILKETLPGTTHVAVFRDPDFGERQLDELQRAAELLKVRITMIEVIGREGIGIAFDKARRSGAGAAMMMWSPLFYVNRAVVADRALKARLPTISDLDAVAEAGVMLSYGSDTYFPFKRSAYFVDRLLGGASAADLPVEQISKLSLTVNLKTAKALGVRVPQSILVRADQLIR
jgi:putative tryptophan/tyrosine transport system substrate-binding protein